MMTKFGEIDNNQIIECLDRYVGRVFQIIPMNENESERDTLPIYVDSLTREFTGNSKILFKERFLEIAGTLQGLKYDNHSLLRTDVFKIIKTIEKLKERVV